MGARMADLQPRPALSPLIQVHGVYPLVLVHAPAICHGPRFRYIHDYHSLHGVTPPVIWRWRSDYKIREVRQSEAVGEVESHARDGRGGPLDALRSHQ